jgi:hypothetical protein
LGIGPSLFPLAAAVADPKDEPLAGSLSRGPSAHGTIIEP